MSCVVRVVGGAGEMIRVLVHRTPPDGCWVGERGRGVLSGAIEWGLGLVGAGPVLFWTCLLFTSVSGRDS